MHRQHPQDQIITLQVAILARRLQVFAIALGLTVMLVGAGHLVAWLSGLLGEASLRAFIMKTNLALCFLLLGAGLALVVGCGETPLRRWCARIAASLTLVIGALTLGENVFGWDLGIDQLLASEPPGALGVVNPNRMGLPASASVVVISMGLLAMSGRGRRAVRVAQGLALGVCLVAVLGITGHLYGVRTLYAVARLTAIAWPSAASLLALGTGLLLVRPTEGVMAQVTADDPGGVSLRRWLPVLPLPLVLGYLRLLGERTGIFDAATGTALMMILFIAALTVLAYTGARAVSQSARARSAADEARRRSDERLALAASATQIGIFDWNLTRRTVLWTQTHEAIFGYAPATTTTTTTTTTEHDYRAWADRVHPGDMPRVEEEVHRCQQERKPLEVQYRIIWPDGSVHWVESKGIFLYDNDGKAERMLGVVMDITERKETENALAAAHTQTQGIIDNATSIIYAFDLEGRFLLANAAVAKVFNTTPEQMIGRRRHEFMPKADADRHEADDRQAIEAGKALEFEEASELPGRSITWLTTKFPLRDAQGKIYAVAGISADISERKRTDEALRRAVEELQRSNKELEQFAYISAHDLQEPLRQVRAYVGRLKDLHADKFEGKAAQYFDFIHDGAARMSELVRGLLEYSRVKSREVVHQPTASDQALAAALANLQAGIDESRAVITHDGLPTVMAEPTQLAQLFQNLIGNAIKFRSPDRPCQVHVAARKLDGHWEFSVRDNGIGIDQQFHEKVFVIFQRLHTREQYPGTGIGLAICKKIVERHGGRIWIESKVGEGTTSFFTLPEASSR